MSIALVVACILEAGLRPTRAETPKKGTIETVSLSKLAQKAAERGLTFLEKDATKWRKERQCSTCHHGTMTLWALCEAKHQGYTVAAESLVETANWTKDRLLTRIDNPRDTRPGWSMVSTPAIYLAVMAWAVPKQEAVSAEELKRIAGHLLRHQESDGCWAWSSAPPKNRPPPFFESDEVATLLGYLALGTHLEADAKEKAAMDESLEKAAAWLRKTKPSDTTQAAVLRLLFKARTSGSAKSLLEIDQLLGRQNKDGGWGQLKDSASDAYATGQALYVLHLAGLKTDRIELQGGVKFLVGSQKKDGSWPMTPRAHSGATPATNAVPITHFGSAWATIGLMRTVPKAGRP